jgi:paraquat-inducible protein B
MSRQTNPATLGGFVLAMLALALLLVLFFTGGNLFSNHQRYELLYDTSVKGLNVGAPVTLKGVPIGQVAEIKARMHDDSLKVLNSVVIEVRPDALDHAGNGRDGEELVEELIGKGLRAQLRTQSLLTGLLYVETDFYPDRPAVFRDIETAYPQIPTISTDLERLTQNLESVDVDQLVRNLQETAAGLNQLVNAEAMQNLAPRVDATLVELQTTLVALRQETAQLGERLDPLLTHADEVAVVLAREVPQMGTKLDETLSTLRDAAAALERSADSTAFLVSEDSPTIYRFNRAARGVEAAAEQMRQLAETLERQPQALLFGKPERASE